MPDASVARRDLLKWAGAAGLAGAAVTGGARARAQDAGSPSASYVAPAADVEGTLTISNWGDPND